MLAFISGKVDPLWNSKTITKMSLTEYMIFTLLIYWSEPEILGHPLKDAVKSGPILEQALSNGMFIMRRRVTQAEALYFCETRKLGRLAMLKTSEDADQLINAIKEISKPYTNDDDEKGLEFGMSRRYWIGLTDVALEGEWVWIKEGSVLDFEDKWTYSQPDHLSPESKNRTEHCVTLWNPLFYEPANNTHTLNDENCMDKHYFICEIPKTQ